MLNLPLKYKVRVRKYKIDEKAFQQMMREYKQKSGLTNAQISEALGIPLTMVGHLLEQQKDLVLRLGSVSVSGLGQTIVFRIQQKIFGII